MGAKVLFNLSLRAQQEPITRKDRQIPSLKACSQFPLREKQFTDKTLCSDASNQYPLSAITLQENKGDLTQNINKGFLRL